MTKNTTAELTNSEMSEIQRRKDIITLRKDELFIFENEMNFYMNKITEKYNLEEATYNVDQKGVLSKMPVPPQVPSEELSQQPVPEEKKA